MQDDFSLESYNYILPEQNIAQHPAEKREHSKLLVLNRKNKTREHKVFSDIIDMIPPGDILVVNDTKVFPARLHGRKSTGGKVEIFLLELPIPSDLSDTNDTTHSAKATALLKSSKKPKPDSILTITDQLHCKIIENLDGGKALVEMQYPANFNLTELLNDCGQIPLPPYIMRNQGSTDQDRDRYQTVYARQEGAVAAPTAGLHFTEELLQKLESKGVSTAKVTLHVGYGTFAPVRVDDIEEHSIHEEYLHISGDNAQKINDIKREGGKVWAVGTTTVRALEYSADETAPVHPVSGWCDLYIIPGFNFKVIDNLITNFHLPQSSLLFLVSALCGRQTLLESYEEAIEKDYRFYSYGDAMVIHG
jgi:S-adenosylmethionine:tRNA ribosyltransferase-isomerase